MAQAWKAVMILVAAVCQILPSGAQTEEQRLRTAISTFSTTVFELKANIKLRQDLPPIAVSRTQARTLRIFSKAGFTIDGAKKYRGLWNEALTQEDNPLPIRAFLTVDRIKFLNLQTKPRNIDLYFGAAIGMIQSSITILNSVFTGCKVESSIGYGGAVYAASSILFVKNSTFSNNAAATGGAVVAVNTIAGPVTIEDSLFIGNKATGPSTALAPVGLAGGGLAILTARGAITISRTTFKANSAAAGGAMLLWNRVFDVQTPIVVESCTFDSNTASLVNRPSGGGAIESIDVTEVRFNKPVFVNNKAGTAPSNIFVTNEVGRVTTIRVTQGTITDIKGNFPGSFVVV